MAGITFLCILLTTLLSRHVESYPSGAPTASKTVVDTIEEKVDQVYEAGAPASQGNLYYYYYPVASYPVHEAYDK